MKENEENRGLNDKKDFEDQLIGSVSVTFFQFSFEVLILFSLSHTLGHLEFSWRSVAYLGFGERRKEE